MTYMAFLSPETANELFNIRTSKGERFAIPALTDIDTHIGWYVRTFAGYSICPFPEFEDQLANGISETIELGEDGFPDKVRVVLKQSV